MNIIKKTFFSFMAILLAELTSVPILFAQYPSGYFRLPIDYTPSLSGSFGEVRTNHLHSGIDFRTQGIEGKQVYAVADGMISRIRISPGGFGKAIYIEHPNGFTTVYAHLRNFEPHIQQYIKAAQYRRESFDVDLYPEPGSMKVKHGEAIAWSGNSGSSGGPHLHFEIRRTTNQQPLNPLSFGLKITDDIPPVIQALKIYPFDSVSHINNKHDPVIVQAIGTGKTYRLNIDRPLHLSGKIAFGIQAYDMHNNSNLKIGYQNMEVMINSKILYKHSIEEFSFDDTRYVNAVIDYEEFINNKRRFIQTQKLPNNPLKIYKKNLNGGIFEFKEDSLYKIEITISDTYGNKATLAFTAKGIKSLKKAPVNPEKEGKILFRYDQENRFETDELIVEIPARALYDDFWFGYHETETGKSLFSKVHHIHKKTTPVHQPYTLKLKLPELPDHLISKAIIVSMDDMNNWISEGGRVEKGWISTSTRNFGIFSIAVDTVAPVITPLNIQSNKDISKQNSIKLKISDPLSGIKSYRGTINGKWILMDYDAKNSLLEYTFDEKLGKGENRFKMVVEDNCGNKSKYEALLRY